jgi:hypothetical protein
VALFCNPGHPAWNPIDRAAQSEYRMPSWYPSMQ